MFYHNNPVLHILANECHQSVKAVADDVYNIINLVKLQAAVVLSLRISSGRTLLQSWAPTDMGNGGGGTCPPLEKLKSVIA